MLPIKNRHGFRLMNGVPVERTEPTRAQLALAQAAIDEKRINDFAQGLRHRHQPATPAEETCVRQMAVAAWQLKGTDMAERELATEAARLLRPFKQQAYESYMKALRRLTQLQALRPVDDKAA